MNFHGRLLRIVTSLSKKKFLIQNSINFNFNFNSLQCHMRDKTIVKNSQRFYTNNSISDIKKYVTIPRKKKNDITNKIKSLNVFLFNFLFSKLLCIFIEILNFFFTDFVLQVTKKIVQWSQTL